MKKNVAGQKIGGQLVSSTDGSAFTGSVTVSVTGDAGTQATGSVGSGACTHEGNGYHTYAPAQAETNYDLVAFTFTGSGAVPATVQVYTDFPQTGDSYARLGAPAGASIAADLAEIEDETDTIIATLGSPAGASVSADIAAAPAALLDQAAGIETNRTLRQALRLILSSAVGKLSGAGTTTVTIRDTNDAKSRVVATVDASGNRSAVTLDAS